MFIASESDYFFNISKLIIILNISKLTNQLLIIIICLLNLSMTIHRLAMNRINCVKGHNYSNRGNNSLWPAPDERYMEGDRSARHWPP